MASAGILAAGLVLLAPAGVTAQASGSRAAQAALGWRITKIIGPVGGVSSVMSLTATGPQGAWETGITSASPNSFPAFRVEHWDGRGWHRLALPAFIRGTPTPTPASAVIGASSAANAWLFAVLQSRSNSAYMLHWNGSAWASARFPDFTEVLSFAVFTTTNAWAFGATVLSSKPFVLHFNGHRWARVAVPLLPFFVSAPSPTDIWASGPSATTFAAGLMHWNGRAWRTLALPRLRLPRGVRIAGVSILAVGARSLWAYAGFSKGQGTYPGAALLHWNGRAWRQVRVPFAIEQPGLIAADGHGGLWLTGYPPGPVQYFFHDSSSGHWSRQPVPSVTGDSAQLSALSQIPGTASLWAAGLLLRGDGTDQGVILKFGP